LTFDDRAALWLLSRPVRNHRGGFLFAVMSPTTTQQEPDHIMSAKPKIKTPIRRLGLTVEELARGINKGLPTVRREIHKGNIKAIRIGRSLIITNKEAKRLGFEL
jgi:excisionase family DNA binding protein